MIYNEVEAIQMGIMNYLGQSKNQEMNYVFFIVLKDRQYFFFGTSIST